MFRTLARLPDWRARFSSYQIECSGRGFRRGEHDCAIYIGRGAEALTGQDFLSLFDLGYSDVRGAVKVLRAFGAGDLEKTIASFAKPLSRHERARAGDVAIVTRPGGKNTGFITDGGISLVGESGLVYVPRDQASAIYKVG